MRKDNKCALNKEMYEEKISILEHKLSEYDKMHTNLNIFDSSSYILGKLAFRDVYNFFDYMTIYTDTLVNAGNIVINEKGLIGIINKTNNNESKVKLLTNINNLSVKVSSSYGIISSYDKKNNLLLVKNISNYKKINIGDEVLTSGLTNIDGGIKVGKVEKIEEKNIEKYIYVKPYVDFNNINYVYVINK